MRVGLRRPRIDIAAPSSFRTCKRRILKADGLAGGIQHAAVPQRIGIICQPQGIAVIIERTQRIKRLPLQARGQSHTNCSCRPRLVTLPHQAASSHRLYCLQKVALVLKQIQRVWLCLTLRQRRQQWSARSVFQERHHRTVRQRGRWWSYRCQRQTVPGAVLSSCNPCTESKLSRIHSPPARNYFPVSVGKRLTLLRLHHGLMPLDKCRADVPKLHHHCRYDPHGPAG